jgi:hypothetical protein
MGDISGAHIKTSDQYINIFTLFSTHLTNARDTHAGIALVTHAKYFYHNLAGKLASEVYLAYLNISTLHSDEQALKQPTPHSSKI